MANICITTYVFEGPAESLGKLAGKLDEAVGMNDFGGRKEWTLATLVRVLGKDPEQYICKGDYSRNDIGLDLEKGRLTLTVESPWSRSDEVEDLIRKAFPDLMLWFCEEESGMGLFVTNDPEERLFGHVIIDVEDIDMEYYRRAESVAVIAALLDDAGFPHTEAGTVEDILPAVEAYNDDLDEGRRTGHHIWVTVAEVE